MNTYSGTMTPRYQRGDMDFDDDHWLIDPRPDLPGGDVYEGLFLLEHPVSGDEPHGLYGTLRGLRCMGAGARRMSDGRARLTPPPDMGRDVWAEFLEPHRARLADLIGRLDPAPEPAPVVIPFRRKAVKLGQEV